MDAWNLDLFLMTKGQLVPVTLRGSQLLSSMEEPNITYRPGDIIGYYRVAVARTITDLRYMEELARIELEVVPEASISWFPEHAPKIDVGKFLVSRFSTTWSIGMIGEFILMPLLRAVAHQLTQPLIRTALPANLAAYVIRAI